MSKYQPLKFPPDFLWGVATAAHQNEGNNTNNDFWQWEQLPGKISDHSTSGLTTHWWDKAGQAEADFDRVAAMGLKTVRLSLEWSRIEPAEGRWDSAAIDRYRELLNSLRQRGLTPMLTLHHFTNPLWLAEQGGWLANKVVERFARYADFAAQSLGDLGDLWGTLNEPMVYATFSHLFGDWTPGHKNMGHTFKVVSHMIEAHTAAARAVHARYPQARVGLVTHYPIFDPVKNSFLDRQAARIQNQIFNQYILDAVYRGKHRLPTGGTSVAGFTNQDDFIGLNYYGRQTVAFDLTKPMTLFGRHIIKTDADMWTEPWPDREIYPEGLFRALKQLAVFKKPIYVTENGLDDATDARRPGFLLTHLAALQRAIQAGVDVRGYYHWTLVDNYEWVEGWSTRFGLIALNPQTQERTPRRSAALFSEIARANAITPAMVKEYAPEAMKSIFG